MASIIKDFSKNRGSSKKNKKNEQNIVTTTATISPSNNLIFNIQVNVSIPSKIAIRYGNKSVGVFQTSTTDQFQNSAIIAVMRLRPSTTYWYRAFVTTSDGRTIKTVKEEFTTGPLPFGLSTLQMNMVGQFTPELILLDSLFPIGAIVEPLIKPAPDVIFRGHVIVDSEGFIVWYYENPIHKGKIVGDIKQLPGPQYGFITYEGSIRIHGDVPHFIRTIRPDTRTWAEGRKDVCTIDTTRIATGQQLIGEYPVHHEVLIPNANNLVYYLGSTVKNPFNNPARLQLVDNIRIWNLNNNSDTKVWSVDTFYNPLTQRGIQSDTPNATPLQCNVEQAPITPQEWVHVNGLSISQQTGNFLISMRFFNTIAFFNPALTTQLFTVGTGQYVPSSFVFPNPTDKFYGNHNPTQLPNGNLLLYDNGLDRPSSEGGQYSRALELSLNFTTMTATKVWEYRHNPDLFTPILGSATRLNNGNTIVNFGGIFTQPEFPIRIVEAGVTSNTAVAELTISSPLDIPPATTNVYRALPLDTLNGEIRIKSASMKKSKNTKC
jgi:hypothetical protein